MPADRPLAVPFEEMLGVQLNEHPLLPPVTDTMTEPVALPQLVLTMLIDVSWIGLGQVLGVRMESGPVCAKTGGASHKQDTEQIVNTEKTVRDIVMVNRLPAR